MLPSPLVEAIWDQLDENIRAHLASECQEWIVDSGASRHFMCRKALLDWEEVAIQDEPVSVRTANGVVHCSEAVVRYIPQLKRYVKCWILEDT